MDTSKEYIEFEVYHEHVFGKEYCGFFDKDYGFCVYNSDLLEPYQVIFYRYSALTGSFANDVIIMMEI